MRHRVAGRKFSRDRGHRKALFKNLINALVLRGEIRTTESKAKAVRRLVEKLITKGKKGTVHSRRLIAAFLQNKKAVNKIVDELGILFKKRPGGFTRIIRLGRRRGDDAMMVKLEFVEKPIEKEKKGEAKRTRKTRKSKGENKNNKR
jgi:large subunit ribosomal protein L17